MDPEQEQKQQDQQDNAPDQDASSPEPDFGQPMEDGTPQSSSPRQSQPQKIPSTPSPTQEAGQLAKERLRKFIQDKIVQGALKTIGSWVAATLGPYAGVIIVAIILIVLCCTPALAVTKKAYDGNWGGQQGTPASFNDPASSALLREFFSNIKGGDPAKLKSSAEAIKAKIAEDKLHFRDKAKATQLLDEMIRLCDEALSAGGSLNQKRIMEIRSELIDLFDDDNPIGLPGRFAHPFPSDKKVTSWGGSTLHGRSAQKTEDDGGHNVFNGFSSPGTGDAVDMGGEYGMPLLAMFNGTITNEGSGRYSRVILRSEGYANKIEAWYCHVGRKLPNGTKVNAGDAIATLGASSIHHVHLEVWVDGKSIHTTAADVASGRHSDEVGKYVWEHIQLAFGIQDH